MKLRLAWNLIFIISLVFITPLLSSGENDAPFILRFENAEKMEVLIDLPAQVSDQFYLHYIHSSDKTPIWDTFIIEENGRFVLIEEAYAWYGAGLEFQNHRDVQLTHEGPWMKVRLNRPFHSLSIRVGRVAQQVFIFRDQSIHLNRLAKPGESVLLSIIRNGEK